MMKKTHIYNKAISLFIKVERPYGETCFPFSRMFIFNLDMYTSSLEIQIFRLKIYISRMEIYFGLVSVHSRYG